MLAIHSNTLAILGNFILGNTQSGWFLDLFFHLFQLYPYCSLIDIIEVTKMIHGKNDFVEIFKNLGGYTDLKIILLDY